MNIALFSDSYLPTKSGIVTVVIQLKKILETLGHHVVVVTVSAGNYVNPDPEYETNVLRVPSIKSPLGDGQFIGRPSKKKIAAFLREHKVQIIHSHTEFSMGQAAVAAGRELNIPVVATTHTMWEDYYRYYLKCSFLIPKSFIRKIVRHVYKDFSAFINVSQKAHDYFKMPFMLPETHSAIIPNAIDSDKFAARLCSEEERLNLRKSLGIEEDDCVMLYVGRVVEEKRLAELYEIAASVVRQNSRAKAVFIGSGGMEQPLRKKCIRDGLQKSIIFTGFIDWTKLYAYYAMADVFITASLSEMHSMTILEALILGKCVVCRRDTSFSDTVFSGVNGYLADTDVEMHSYLLGLVNNRSQLKKMGEEGSRISRSFTLEKHGRRTLAFYNKILEKYPSVPSDFELQQAVDSVES